MKKLSLVILLAITVGLVYGDPVTIIDPLTGYTGTDGAVGSTEDSETVDQLAVTGFEPQIIWGGGDGTPDPGGHDSWERIELDENGATFGLGQAGDDGRNMLRTIETTYNTVTFEAYVTVNNLVGGQNVFMGLGAGVKGAYGVPDWQQGTDAVFAELRDADSTVWLQNASGDTSNAAVGAGEGTHRIKLAYDVDAQTVSVSVDLDYDGTFVEDFVIDTVSTEGLWAAGEPARVYIGADDNAVLTDFHIIADSLVAQDPVPSSGQDLVDKNNVTFEWNAPEDYVPTEYTLYLREGDPNFQLINIIDGESVTPTEDPTTYDAGSLEFETEYFWRVDTSDGTTTYEGKVWSFTTAPAVPVVIEDPDSQTVAEGEDATFTVDVQNGGTYQWYFNGVAISGATTDTLEVTGVSLADEGEYYCEITNATTVVVTTEIATLWTERLMGSWTFDSNLTDSGPDGWDGVYTDPNEALDVSGQEIYDNESVSGQSLSLAGEGRFVKIIDSESWFNFYAEGFTVSAWVKSSSTGGYETLFSKTIPDLSSGFGISYHFAEAATAVRGVSGEAWSGGIETSVWHQFAAVYDTEEETLEIYVDGLLKGTVEDVNTDVTTNSEPAIIGAENVEGGASYNGLLDDLKIWSYAKDALTIAQEFTAETGAVICLDDEGLQYDFNDDCIVDIADFAEFASTWLNCRQVPTCLQQFDETYIN